ncbi:MAG: SsrA-binding protein SmpB [Phycisphaerales bacterium]|nr:SsrA-binding protein SmpB [Phycisphaerales bacterium]
MTKPRKPADTPEIHNRKARHDYRIDETLEVGIKLFGTEVKSVRAGKVSIAEGYVRAELSPPCLFIHGMHVDPYSHAGAPNSRHQHHPTRTRVLLAHKREIAKLHAFSQTKGHTLVPLKLYFKDGRAKLLIGCATGKQQADKRQDIKARDAQREIRRAMSKRL